MSVISGVVALVVAVVSAIYSYVEGKSAARRAKKAREAAEDARRKAEDAAKGFQIPVEGQSAPLPVYFGRNLAGGIRVYHGTFNAVDVQGQAAGCIFASRSMGTGYFSGEKHEYLAVQQVLCKGSISSVVTVDIDQMPITEAIYAGYHDILVYSNGSVADPTAAANEASRGAATFPGMTYASCLFKLNRDDPNYSGVPTLQFYITGTPVEYIEFNGTNWYIAGTVYSNNPALCLLHYLLNKDYGRGMSVEEIDLASFYKAYAICEKVVMSNVPREGRLWNTLGAQRDVKLFECNIAIDTSKPIRDNIEKILETMSLAELIWSDGKYSLSLHYPMLYNSSISYTQNDIVQASYNGFTKLYRSKVSNNTPALSNIDGWTAVNGTLSADFEKATYTATVSDSSVRKTVNIVGSACPILRLRFKRTSGSGAWEGICFYATSGHPYHGGYYKAVALPPLVNETTYIVDWDMSALTLGGTDWSISTITQLRFDLTLGVGDTYELETLLVGTLNADGSFTTLQEHPFSNWAKDAIAAEITDDDIIRGAEMATIWPDAQTRLNYATVHFLNESKDFTNDSASWPSKYGYVNGANTYKGVWDPAGVYNKSDSVYFGGTTYQFTGEMTFYSTISPKTDTAHWTLMSASYTSAPVWVQNSSYYLNDLRSVVETINGAQVVSVYKLTSGPGYVSATPPNAGGYWQVKSDMVYSAYKAEDAEMPLEGDFHEEGVGTFYHALAKAEQRVRQSRDAVLYKLTLSRSKVGIEPGDMVYVDSQVLYIPGELLRIESIKVNKEGNLDVFMYKFDARLLAWNVADNEVVTARNIFNVQLLQAENIELDLFTIPTQMTSLCYLRWQDSPDTRVTKYSIRYTTEAIGAISEGTLWVEIGKTDNNFFEIPYLDEANITLTVVAQTASGRSAPRFTADSKWPTIALDTSTIAVSPVTDVTITSDNTSLVIGWTTTFTPRYVQYEVRIGYDWTSGTKIETTSSNNVRLPYQPAGPLHAMVRTVSKAGKYSATYAETTLSVSAPAMPAVTSQVIDNNVLLYWTQPMAFQPIRTYEVRKGLVSQSYGEAEVIGEKSGLFTTIFETQSGEYKYWITAIDMAGNYGAHGSEISSVSQPPDYNFINDFYTTFTTVTDVSAVTFSNAIRAAGSLVIPATVGQTFAQHSTLSSRTTPQQQITANFPHYIQPVPTAGYYQEILDYGAGFETLTHVMKLDIIVTYLRQVSGAALTISISTSVNGTDWSLPIYGSFIYASGFRYIKVRFDVTSDTKGFIEIDKIRYATDTKLKNESGMKDCLATDASGTVVTFTNAFHDIMGITVTPAGTAAGGPVIAIYDFVDITNPTYFKVLLYNLAGARVSGRVSWSIKGY